MIPINNFSTVLTNLKTVGDTAARTTREQATNARALLQMPPQDAWEIIQDPARAASYPASAIEAVIWSVLEQASTSLSIPTPAASEAFDPERMAANFRALVEAANPKPVVALAPEGRRKLADLTFSASDKAEAAGLESWQLLHGLRFGGYREVANGHPRGYAAILEAATERARDGGKGITSADIQHQLCTMVGESSSAYNGAILALAAESCEPSTLFLAGLENARPDFMRSAARAHHVLGGGMSGSESELRSDMFQIGIRGAKLDDDTLERCRKTWPEVPHLISTLDAEVLARATARGARNLIARLAVEKLQDQSTGGMTSADGHALVEQATQTLYDLAHPDAERPDERFVDRSRPNFAPYLTREDILPAVAAAYENNLGRPGCESSVRALARYLDPAVLLDIDRRVYTSALERGDARAVYDTHYQTRKDRYSYSSGDYELESRLQISDLRDRKAAAVEVMMTRLATETFADPHGTTEYNQDVTALVAFIVSSRTYRKSAHQDEDAGAFAQRVRDTLRGLHARSKATAPGVAQYLERSGRLKDQDA